MKIVAKKSRGYENFRNTTSFQIFGIRVQKYVPNINEKKDSITVSDFIQIAQKLHNQDCFKNFVDSAQVSSKIIGAAKREKTRADHSQDHLTLL
eukprot:UN22758